MQKNEIEFLKESNAIEGVYDDDSLNQAKFAWEYLMSEDILTTHVILKTHKILMLHQKLYPNEKGYWRDCYVRVGGKTMPGPEMVPVLMRQWAFEAMRAHPPVDSKELHIQYEQIHPFVDGNGRTGRMFMNWIRLKRTGEPLLIIKESEKEDYYNWFR